MIKYSSTNTTKENTENYQEESEKGRIEKSSGMYHYMSFYIHLF
jgi:hypothetical protein